MRRVGAADRRRRSRRFGLAALAVLAFAWPALARAQRGGADRTDADGDPASPSASDPNTSDASDPNTSGASDPNTSDASDPKTSDASDPKTSDASDANDGGERRRAERGYIGKQILELEIDHCPTISGDDATREGLAFEHYNRGEVLYTQGDYEGAVAEFVAAYCHKPFFRMLRNIAQSFERLLAYDRAVAYLERFILDAPDDTAKAREERQVQQARLQVLLALPARLQVATVPPGAAITLSSDSGVRAVGVSNGERLEVGAGTYSMAIELPGYQRAVQDVTLEIGQPYSYYVQLEPQRGTLRVQTNPADARIFVDQRLVGIGAYSDEVPIGRYTVTAEAGSRAPVTRQIEVTAGGVASVPIDLPQPARSGRTQLVVAAAIIGGLGGGAAMAVVAGEEATQASLGVLAGMGIGLGGAYYGVPSSIPLGDSSFIIGATAVGATNAVLVSRLLVCSTAPDANNIDRNHDECSVADNNLQLAAGVIGTIGSALVAALTARRLDLDAGDASLINSGSLWGGVGGFLLSSVFDNDARVSKLLLLSGLDLGTLAGVLLARQATVSRSHMALIDLSGLAGLVVGTAVRGIGAEQGANESLPNFALAGMTVGLIAGSYLTRNIDVVKLPVQPRTMPITDGTGRAVFGIGVGGAF